MGVAEPRLRRAALADLPALQLLIAASARDLSKGDYTPAQVEGALRGPQLQGRGVGTMPRRR